MTIKEQIRVDLGDSVLFNTSRTLAEGKEFRPLSSLGGFVVERFFLLQLMVKDDGLEGMAILSEEMGSYIMSGGKAKNIHPIPVRLESDQINRPGSQLYTKNQIGPFTLWRILSHTE